MIDYTLLLVLQGAALLGILAGVMGTCVLLRQQSLLGDALSHAALPGILTMFLCTQSKNPWILLIGGGCVGVCGVIVMHLIMRYTRLKKDTILGIILSVFFGCGLVLMSLVQKYAGSGQAIINRFLFGSVATLLPSDIVIISSIALVVLGLFVLLWKEISLYLFDPHLYILSGFSVRGIEIVLTGLLLVVIIVGLQTVGVVLMSTMLVAPAAAARQWTKHLWHMVILSAFFGGLFAVIGVIISAAFDHLPTGPMIVIVATLVVMISLVCAPERKCSE